MTARRTSIKLIEKAVSEKWIRQLAFYHLLKYQFNNSCIYNYRSRMNEIAGKLNICTKTLYNYLTVLKEKELVQDHASNLILKSLKGGRIKTTLIINDDLNINDLTCLMYAKLIEKKAHQMAFAESVRRCGRGDRFNYGLCAIPFRPSLSYRTIAKVCNISEFTAYQVTKKLVKMGIIRIEKQKHKLISDNFTSLSSIKDYPGYRYNIGKKLFEIFGQKIDFLQFPVYLKRVSLRQVLKSKNTIYRNKDVIYFTSL